MDSGDRRSRRRWRGWTRSPGGCGASARGTASRTSARSCRTRSRRPTSWPTPRTVATTRKLLDELGDVLFQVHFLALLLEERGAGDLARSPRHVTEKLIRRHPHVFGEVEVATRPRCCATGTRSSATEPGREPGVFGEVPENLPAPLYARKVQRRAASSGFDFAGVERPLQSVRDELDELRRRRHRRRALPRARRRAVRGGQRRAQAEASIPSWRCAPQPTGSAAACRPGSSSPHRRAGTGTIWRPTSSSPTTPAPA